MSLTARQREYLAAALELQQSGGVHYSAVAEKLGVSPWTAYDLLARLVSLGYLAASSNMEERPHCGRSRVLFSATPKAHEALGWPPVEDWQRLEAQLHAALACQSEHQFAFTIRRRLADLARYRTPFLYCSHMVLVFLLCLRALTRNSDPNMVASQFAGVMGSSQNLLLSVAGGVMALLILRRQSPRLLPALTANICEYERQLATLPEPDKESLLRFTRRALAEIATGRQG